MDADGSGGVIVVAKGVIPFVPRVLMYRTLIVAEFQNICVRSMSYQVEPLCFQQVLTENRVRALDS